MDNFNYEIRNDSVHIEGYVNAVERDSNVINTREGRCVENITAGAFGEALDRADNVDILLNHNTERKLGSTSDGNLQLYEDSIGLRAITDITDADVIEKARKGELRGWSFGFIANKTRLEKRSEGVPRRHIDNMNVYEVSLIDNTMNPCYNGCNVEVRAEGEIEYRGTDVMENINRNEQEQMKLELEMRYNPYHDPSNGRFCSGGGTGMGAMIVVPKGGKAYVQQLNKGFSDEEIFDMYEEYKKAKETTKTDFYRQKFNTADEYKKALAEKYNGITDVDKIKTAKDVSDFINYDTQKGYYASYRKGEIQSTWNDPRYGKKTSGELARVRDAGFSSKGTTVIDLPTGSKEIYKGALEKLDKAGIRVGEWYDDKYMILKKPRVRVSKWLEGINS